MYISCFSQKLNTTTSNLYGDKSSETTHSYTSRSHSTNKPSVVRAGYTLQHESVDINEYNPAGYKLTSYGDTLMIVVGAYLPQHNDSTSTLAYNKSLHWLSLHISSECTHLLVLLVVHPF